MAKLHDMRLKLLIQQEHERISKSQPNDLDLSIVKKQVISRVLFILIKMGNHLSRTGITSQPQAALKSRFCNGHKPT